MISVSVQIDSQSPLPVRDQIASAYGEAIRAGRLPAGTPLPSVRGLSGRLRVSPTTVVAAYRELCASGLVLASPRSGYRVAGSAQNQRREYQLNRIEPDLRLHPVKEFARLVFQTASDDERCGGYEEYRGYLGLREAVTEIDREIGIASDPVSGMLITSGSQQALALIARIFDAGIAAAVEDPCYPGARLAFGHAGARVVPVAMTEDGPDAESLRRLAEPGAVAAFYCCPTYANPTGRTWSEAARRRVLEAAATGGFLVIEDDYLGDLDYLGEQPTRLAVLAAQYPQARVVRIRTFSKCLLPALRIASVTAEPALIARLLALKVADDLGCSAFLQRALARFIRQGDYARHLERVRPRYRMVRETLRDVLAGLRGPLRFDDPPAGLCLLGRLDADVDPARFIAECAKSSVLVSPGADYWLQAARGSDQVRIGFGALAPDEVAGVVTIMDAAAAAARGFAGEASIL
ncbi:PLP-dependent aminotransferase family protein [Propionivibrio soli]|uniref:aminotransferase-like domain-containing protein n=1 Tax=Propionivibrio soli TaxID=2976531 RepID=UPI0021E83FFA|nr:PLP-dependent aminotransferase family protein [Propionivibrio soli]